MGNRGCLHGADQRLTGAQWARKQWVICELAFNNRHRQVMAPGKYTELFFLDEATALAAGHRPCGTCRKLAYRHFLSSWHSMDTYSCGAVSTLDDLLHVQRTAVIGLDALPLVELNLVPDGCIVGVERRDNPCIVYERRLFSWTFNGYAPGPSVAPDASVFLITPLVTRDIIARGYIPQVHASVTREVHSGVTLSMSSAKRRVSESVQRAMAEIRDGQAQLPVGKTPDTGLYRLRKSPGGKQLYAYFAAILDVTGMLDGKSYPLKNFVSNFSGHENAGRILKAGPGNYRLSETGIAYFKDRLQPGNPQHITPDEVNRYKQCILRGCGKEWIQIL